MCFLTLSRIIGKYLNILHGDFSLNSSYKILATPINPFHELTCQSNIHAKLDCRGLLKQRPSDLKYHQTFELFVMAVGHKHITLLPQKEIFYPRDHLSICTKSMGVLIATFLQRKVALRKFAVEQFSHLILWTWKFIDNIES